MLQTEKQYVQWQENETLRNALWLSESNHMPPARIVLVDDTTTADDAYRLACEGSSLLWRGDFHNARQLLQALGRRIDRTNERSELRKAKKAAKSTIESDSVSSKEIPNLFHQQRQLQAQRSRILSRLLLELDASYVSQLRARP
ncbi:hypothetical protein [Psychrobacter sp. WY6]|uniref:hypothetical protein n=1 Tax=Psychrobacter sp. WY6 TaxID=2708350 RepID=UPI002022E309|nr:hypothetical protein [Psychrobacter sp. WY6]